MSRNSAINDCGRLINSSPPIPPVESDAGSDGRGERKLQSAGAGWGGDDESGGGERRERALHTANKLRERSRD